MKRWVLLLLILLAAEVVLLANNAALDTLAWRTTRWVMGDQDSYRWGAYKARFAESPAAPFWQKTDPPLTRADAKVPGGVRATLYTKTEKLWRLFRDLGEPLMTVILVVVVTVYDRRWWKAGVILAAAAAAAGATGMLIRAAAGRLRPDGVLIDPETFKPLLDPAGKILRNDGGNFWYPLRGFSFDASDLAFPSGHATLAFATAAVLAYLSPRGRILMFTLAAMCALARVVMQAHFYADAILGAAVGLIIGHVLAARLDRWIPDPRRPMPRVALEQVA